jgi:hypothetical protein
MRHVVIGIRQRLGESKSLGVGVAVLLLIGGALAVGYQLSAMGPPKARAPQIYYTIDEGKTLFTDSAELLPPFEHKGKPAVRACVYECSGKQFVGYLERFTDEAKRMIKELDDAVKNAKPGGHPPANLQQLANARRFGREVKRPGDSNWVSIGSKEGAHITTVHAPPGMTGTPELVQP